MSELSNLMAERRWVYWLDKTHPGNENLFRVSIVVENESGHFPTGGHGKEPWYWSEATCEHQNRRRGITAEDELQIITSSMFSRNRQ